MFNVGVVHHRDAALDRVIGVGHRVDVADEPRAACAVAGYRDTRFGQELVIARDHGVSVYIDEHLAEH